MGLPDLVQLIKQTTSSEKGVSTFFYYTGTDVSSPASVAASLYSLANIITESPQLWFGKTKPYKVTQATYCTFNAFSGIDLRVTAHIPGKVESEMFDVNGEKIQVSDNERLWTEAQVSAVVRALVSADDDEQPDYAAVVEVRKVNPFATKEAAKAFFAGFETLFAEGPKLGCCSYRQTPTLTCNFLVDAFLKAVQLTEMFDEALQSLYSLEAEFPEVANIIARVFLLKDAEVEAVKLMCERMSKNPMDGDVLVIQSNFLLQRGSLDLALSCAVRAVKVAPSDFKSWEVLAKVYTSLEKYEDALLTLNSCPMVTQKDRYHLRRVFTPDSKNMHLPLPVDVTLDRVSSLNSADVVAEHNSVDPMLTSLPAANLKSTFAKAYTLLTAVVNKTGWEALLKCRAKVFVMEEEYKSASSTTLADKKVGEEERSSLETSNGGDFRKKRLCERWLDNLFMLLYEDLKIFTMYRAEYLHFQAQQIEYKKTALEWELLGLVSLRLMHKKEASECFENALKKRFSFKASAELLKYSLKEKEKTHHLLYGTQEDSKKSASQELSAYNAALGKTVSQLIVSLSVWNHRWYCEFSPLLINALKVRVAELGIVKVESEVQADAATSGTGVFELMNNSFHFLKEYEIFGSEA